MKTLTAIAMFILAVSVYADEGTRFETVKKPKIGESNAIEISKSQRAVLKTGDGFIILDLLDSSREDGDDTFTEACRISWTLITPSSVWNDMESAFIRCRSEKTGDSEFTVKKIEGSDKIVLGGVSLRWSYGSSERVYLYAEPGTQYTTTKAQQGTPPSESKSESKKKTKPRKPSN